jgi:hypothetical protein
MPTLVLVATELYPIREIPPVRVGPPQPTGGPPDLGTVQVFSDVVRQKQGQKQVVVGEHSGTCVHVRAPNMWFCHAGWILEDVGPPGGKMTGTLVAGGLLDYDALPEWDVAIFGGTGAFKRVVGEIHGNYVAPKTEYTLHFEIVP